MNPQAPNPQGSDELDESADSPSEAAPASPPLANALVGLTRVGVLAALPAELGPFLPEEGTPGRAAETLLGVDVHEPVLEGVRRHSVVSACSGVGKVAAAHAALALVTGGAEALFVVGTCGGLSPTQQVGDLIHVVEAIQWDLSVRGGRETLATPGLWRPWMAHCPGSPGLALTADRPAMRWISRLRRARAVRSRNARDEASAGAAAGDSVSTAPIADMETAAVAAVAARAGVPWAALRVISDSQRSLLQRAVFRGAADSSFMANYPTQASRPAASLAVFLRGSPICQGKNAGFLGGHP